MGEMGEMGEISFSILTSYTKGYRPLHFNGGCDEYEELRRRSLGPASRREAATGRNQRYDLLALAPNGPAAASGRHQLPELLETEPSRCAGRWGN